MKNGISKDRILAITASVLALVVIVLSTLGLLDVIEYSLYLTTPLLSVILAIQTYMNWDKHKGVAIFSLCAGIFVLVCSVAIIIFM